ncbi:SDR family NAD(P)-dependent oxidoreductase [Citricoccus sp.]|uniref:SDR family NAD(P)-dependent oxidoreductase n=1 Tax=Citricoccus sp. TaxID=1978372 RepID=UPI0028BD26E0|nr:SDR family NAD(P)-dependent oxidoreductase [Citricoccus sp.]
MTTPIWTNRFDGQVILVTGAAGGLGRTSVERLAAEGAIVVATDLKSPDNLAGHSGAFLAMELDVTRADHWRVAVDSAVEQFGRLDGLLMCHGAQGPEADVERIALEDWQRTLRINLDSCFLGLQAVMPTMKRQSYGRVAVLSSISGREGNASMSAYSTSKAAVIALVKSVAKEAAADGITINAVAPSMFQTPLLQHLSEERNAALLSRVPMGRIGQPLEFAALAAWLLSAECSYTTGQVLDLSGGRYAGS